MRGLFLIPGLDFLQLSAPCTPRSLYEWKNCPEQEKFSLFFINFWLCVKQFIFRSFLAISWVLTAPHRIHWPFLGLDVFHNLQLREPVKEIWLICQNDQFSWFWGIFVIFGHFWSIFRLPRGLFSSPGLNFFAAISPLHSIESIWMEKLPFGGTRPDTRLPQSRAGGQGLY